MVYSRIARFVPKVIVQNIEKQLDFIGIEIDEKRFVGFLVLFGLALSTAVSINLLVFLKIPAVSAETLEITHNGKSTKINLFDMGARACLI